MLTYKYTIMCDDVRQEANGKLILIGCYLDTVALPHIPIAIPGLTFFQVYESDRPGNISFRVRLERMDTGQVIAQAMGMGLIPKPGLGVAPVRLAPIPFPVFGTYNLVVEIEGEQPTIFSFNVTPSPQMPFNPPQFTQPRPL
jgi:uncharacterized protein DUF6941